MRRNGFMKLSLVIPCYNEEQNVRPMYEACCAVLGAAVPSFEMIFINDGSSDGTWACLEELYEADKAHVRLVDFSRNFGKEAAMYAGLQRAAGDYVTIIDADLQQRPEVALEMVRFLDANPDYDCVAAYQAERHEGVFTKLCKKVFYKIINIACQTPIRPDASDFRTFRRPMVEAVLAMKEYHRFSKGIFSFVGFTVHYMPYTAEARHTGRSTWSFWKLFRYAKEGIASFTTFPLRIATLMGSVMSVLSLAYLIVVVVQRLAYGIDVPGYATIVALILLIGGLQMIMLGIIGSYVARIYVQSKQRPLYIAREYRGGDAEEDAE